MPLQWMEEAECFWWSCDFLNVKMQIYGAGVLPSSATERQNVTNSF